MVDYYYIDFFYENTELDVLRWSTPCGVMDTIWEVLSTSDMNCLDGHSICIRMMDGTMRPIWFMRVDRECRELRISRID